MAKKTFVAGSVLRAADVNEYLTSSRNKIINGDFSINQRALNSTGTTSSGYGFDRWAFYKVGGTVTYSAQSFTPGTCPTGYESANFARVVSTGQSATTDQVQFYQGIEDVRTLAGQTVTISFWAKAASGTPKVAIALDQAFGSGGSAYVNNYVGQATLGSSWTRYSFTYTMPSITGKTVGTGNASYLIIYLSAGSNFNASTGSLGIQNNTFDFWGVQVEEGSTATPFNTATGTLQGELAACQRYYWRTYGSTNIGQSTPYDTSNTQCTVKLPVTMRVKPHSFDWTGTLGNYGINNHLYKTPTAISADGGSNTDLVTLNISTSGGYTLGQTYIFNVANGAYIGFSAEL